MPAKGFHLFRLYKHQTFYIQNEHYFIANKQDNPDENLHMQFKQFPAFWQMHEINKKSNYVCNCFLKKCNDWCLFSSEES